MWAPTKNTRSTTRLDVDSTRLLSAGAGVCPIDRHLRPFSSRLCVRGFLGLTNASRRGTKGMPRTQRQKIKGRGVGRWKNSSNVKTMILFTVATAISENVGRCKLGKRYLKSGQRKYHVDALQYPKGLTDVGGDSGHPCAGKSTSVNNSDFSNISHQADEGYVYAIIDRKTVNGSYWYKVQWRDEPDGFRWTDSWHPGARLCEDGFEAACTVVDLFKDSGKSSFYDFCRENGHVRKIGDSPKGTCAVIALDVAVALSGNLLWNTLPWFDEFRALCLQRKRPLSISGITTGELRKFIKFGNSLCPDTDAHQISICEFDINILGGINGKKAQQALIAIDLQDGAYVCAAFSSLRVTHSFTVLAHNGSKLVYDGDENVGVRIELYDNSWIFGVIFLRRIMAKP